MLSNDFTYRESVYHTLVNGRKMKTFKQIMDILGGELREEIGRHKAPSAGMIDSQSVEITDKE
jgi:hypothetical protein